ncbi:DNA-processing protein DprA [Porticoccaceae bacterium LTM1]|nr:DNA-processing protein DprA [Porticoccaceae bacterium LTM1]
MEKEIHAILWLQRVANLSTTQLVSLWHHFGDYQSALDASESELSVALPETALDRLLTRRDQGRLHIPFADEQPGEGTTLLPITSPDYPKLLKEIHTPPPLLYVKGDVSLLSMPQLGIVGSRRHTMSGGETARAFARELSYCGFTITSGLAIGIDGMAHRGAMDGGKTIAVLGTGVEYIYPRIHQRLAQEILESGGTLVSEQPADTAPLPSLFPQRNRIISGLSLGVLVVEAARKSGSLITARCAMEQGREVFAMPGSVHSPVAHGCHQLIRDGATLVECVEDIGDQLGGMLELKKQELSSNTNARPELNLQEKKLLDLLGFDPVDFDALISHSGMDTPRLTSTLMDLELKGLLQQDAGRYLRVK